MALGGMFQKDEGCTLDEHCDQHNGPFICQADTVLSNDGTYIQLGGKCVCPDGQERFEVQFQTDNYPFDIYWTLTDKCGYGVIAEKGLYLYFEANTLYTTVSRNCFNSNINENESEYEFKIRRVSNFCFGSVVCSVQNLAIVLTVCLD